MSNFWNSIKSEFSAAGNFLGSLAHQGFQEFNNIASNAEGVTKDIANKGFSTIDSTIHGAVNLAQNAENKVSGLVSGAEDILSLPLILLAGGVAYFLISKNGETALNIAGNVAMKKL